ncbi:MAG: UPF0182 family protein [Chloroflexota bacterium]|nr:UPF0182 family protein [Chloroflexota bacterium]
MSSFDKRWQRWFTEKGEEVPSTPSRPKGKSSRVLYIIAGVFVLFLILNTLKGFYTEWLWFSNLSYGSVYVTILKTKVLLFFAAAIIFCILFLANLVLATRLASRAEARFWPWSLVPAQRQKAKLATILVTVVLAMIFGSVAQGNWETVLQFFNAQPFGITDPVFHREASFYVFSLPFLNMLKSWFLGALVVTLIATAGIYFLSSGAYQRKPDFARPVLLHIGGLGMAILGLFAWGYWLGIWELVFSPRGVVSGASYTDMHAKLPSQWILLAVVLICMGLIVFSILRRKPRWILYGVGGWVVIAILVGGVFPSLMQRFQVQPSEFAMERPYIEYNIQATRDAFGLSEIDEESFPAEQSPTRQDILTNSGTIANIRLWDHRPLKDTYNQIQAIRLYYDFHDVDVDRYVIDGEHRQVMLSARELSAEKLAEEAQTWVNRRLQFTHGYGVALSPVNEVTPEGLPELLAKDIPPAGSFDIERPQIYFGEKTNDYVIVQTRTQEFDYPKGEQNVYGHYEGEGGVKVGTFFRRLVYAWQFGDLNILISNELSPESRVLYYRNIAQRVKHLAPFLQLDSDPYLVLMNGRMLWIQDAYTITDRYPYSQPLKGGLNYIRNSVKAVIDAYDGSVTFYVTDSEDALIQTYQAIFPELFVPVEQMPEALRAHIRYPLDMFDIQAAVYQSYHMQDARVFYNKEDLWAVPKEVYSGNEQPVVPYYITMRLRGEQEEEFLLMQPFTPVNKNNTIGWLAARCDGENYGKVLAYLFPKERLVYGPSQIENRIQQDTVITEQLALWGRGGSRVIRGNMLMIPLGQSNLYVEPVFLQAEAGGLPELKRVIVAAGEQIAMRQSLGESIAAIFGTETLPAEPGEETPPTTEPQGPVTPEMASLIEEAQQHYDAAQQYLKAGDWAGYGKELEELKAVLNKLAELSGKA